MQRWRHLTTGGADGRGSEAGGRPRSVVPFGTARPPTCVLWKRPQHNLTLGVLLSGMAKLLLTSQRNAVLLAVREAGLDPRDFAWTMVSSKLGAEAVSRLRHTSSGYYFIFDFKGEKQYAIYSPGDEVAATEQFPGDWKNQLHYCRLWLSYVKRETEAPDLWTALAQSADVIADVTSPLISRDLFTTDEQSHIRVVLNDVAAYIRSSHDVTQQRLASIESQLEYLADSASRSSRRDWGLMLLGTVVNIVTSAALPPDRAQAILQLIGAGLRWLFQGSPLLPTPLQ